MTDQDYRQIFADAETIAVVGLSANPDRPSSAVAMYLRQNGYRIIPVNPGEDTILGEVSYPDLDAVPDEIDIVAIFRRPEYVPEIVNAAVRVGAKVVWMQDGSGNPEAAAAAEKAGLKVVVNDCLLRQHRRLFGR